MATIRERLDSLTAKLWASVDVALADETEVDSIAASTVAIDTIVAERAAMSGVNDPLTAINASIAVITAIAANQRTDAQKDTLELLRIVKAQQQAIFSLTGEVLDNRRRIKVLQRNHSVLARFAMFLDGGPQRVRQGDIDGSE